MTTSALAWMLKRVFGCWMLNPHHSIAEHVQMRGFSPRFCPFMGGFHDLGLRDLPPDVSFVQCLSQNGFMECIASRMKVISSAR
jgi:hypothetical protein